MAAKKLVDIADQYGTEDNCTAMVSAELAASSAVFPINKQKGRSIEGLGNPDA